MKFLHNRWTQLLALTAFLGSIGVYALREKFCVTDPDTWWHLKVGDWMIEHMALPHTGILSRSALNRPWVAYSWGYEVLLSRAYAWFGLIGIGLFGVVLTLAVAAATFWMMRRLSNRFWPACLLSIAVCAAFLFNGAPRPAFFTYILYCPILVLLFEAQRSGRVQTLYWLPLLFLLWANLHIQFVYGLFTVVLFVTVHLGQQLLSRLGFNPKWLSSSSLLWKPLIVILAACILATLIGPNLYHPYLAVLAYTKAKFSYKVIVELQPLPFRFYSNFIELFLAAAGFYAVGWQKKIDPFKLALLAVTSMVAFRTMRDAWFICYPAAACIADFPSSDETRERAFSWQELAGLTAAIALVLALAAPLVHFNTRELDRSISRDYPVNAINFLRRNPVPGPLYNNLNWGGFLMWYLPELPVSVDGRNDLYGDALDEMFYNSESAFPSYSSDPYLSDAGVVILNSQLPLAKILTVDSRFRLIYQDQIAMVFAHQ
jgi:hypothetical protein